MRALRVVVCWLVVVGTLCEDVVEQEVTSEASVTDQNFFINEIFSKYGDRGVISFEGFEHLLESLGLGHLEFDKSHTVALHRVNGTFREVHDDLELHQHQHDEDAEAGRRRRRRGLGHGPEHHAQEIVGSQRAACLSPQAMLSTFGLAPDHGVVISTQRFQALCPALVYELDQRACYPQQATARGDKSAAAWWMASLSVLVISLVGLVGVAVVPLVHKTYFQSCLQFLVALAVGTLLGDALLHLLPHAMHSHDHRTSALRAAVAFSSIGLFYVLEVGVRALTEKPTESKLKGEKGGDESDGVELESMMKQRKGHDHSAEGVSSVAWMVVMGDGLHNLTDGLAIGAAFSSDTVAGFATTLAVFCHELPHEIGDFAVLLSAGVSVKRALLYNVFSSVLSFIGMAMGVWLGEYEDAAPWIYAFTAGTFLYISLVDLVPELSSGATSRCNSVAQLVGVMAGGAIMLAIALFEDDLVEIFHTIWLG